MKPGIVVGGVLMALLATSCGDPTESSAPPPSELGNSGESAPPTSAVRPTLTDPKLQPPLQDNKYTQSTGRPKVAYDPCTWTSDAEIESLGFQPASRKRGPDLVAEYTFLTCTFGNADNTLSLGVDSGNITWEESLKKDGGWLQPTTVNGRRAGFGKGAQGSENECHVHLETKAGIVMLWTNVSSLGRRQNLDPCTNIMEIASVVEKSIGKDN